MASITAHTRFVATWAAVAVVLRVAFASLVDADVVHLGLLWRGVEGASGVWLMSIWARSARPLEETRLACVLMAVHPTLVTKSFDAGMMVVWLGVLTAWQLGKGNIWWRIVGSTVFCVYFVFAFLLVIRPAVNLVSPWDFWLPVSGELTLREGLSAYLFDGGIYALALVGAAVTLKHRPLPWIATALMICMTWFHGYFAAEVFTRATILPICIFLASIGAWRIYAGMGRFGGHGILAVDPVKKPRARKAADG